jgi:hypothetical protein
MQLAEDGFCILEGLLDAREADRLDALARSLMSQQTGYVKLEGARNPVGQSPLLVNRHLIRGSLPVGTTVTSAADKAIVGSELPCLRRPGSRA